jgi:hypothetical protein
MVQFLPDDDAGDAATGTDRSRSARGGRGVNVTDATISGPVFTVDSANRLLPLVTRIAVDLVSLSEGLDRDAAQIRGIEMLPRKSDIRTFTEELDSVKEAFRLENERLDVVRNELASLGVHIDSIADGYFDFPAMRDGHPIRLCWKLGEPEILYWHHVGETYRQRRQLEAQQPIV